MGLKPIPLPPTTLALHKKVPPFDRHPGLQLDKFVAPPESQEDQKEALKPVLETAGDPALLDNLLKRRAGWLEAQKAATFRATTAGPLTLHLSRATALENAGICLHPLYGFVYLPGTGLKGMARAYAETVWCPAQPDPQEAWTKIEAVFGWSPGSDKNKPWKPEGVRRPEHASSAGDVIFHDAWPATWPKLELDIVNNHHQKYYQKGEAPGDWESPTMVSFLAVPARTEFRFALAKRSPAVSDALLDLARQWLLGALVHEGAGAKTAAGYGAFTPVGEESPELVSPSRDVFEATLELVTPAFLAGARQEAADCDLRPATLRGLLRWWWRTMHAGHVDVKTLRRLEAAVWGDTNSGGAVRVQIAQSANVCVDRYDKRSKANMQRREDKTGPQGIPGYRDPDKVTQGLWYASFGMDEKDRQRSYVEPGATWIVRIVARPSLFFESDSDARDPRKQHLGRAILSEQIVEQAKAALWLLCHFGGVGSKGRKGFGSLLVKELLEWRLKDCFSSAEVLRRDLKLSNAFDERMAMSPSLKNLIALDESIQFCWPSVWSVLDQVGFAYQQQAKRYEHQVEKNALGLPRRIGKPSRGRFEPGGPVKKMIEEAHLKRKEGNVRHASPVHFHVARAADGCYRVQVVAFPSMYLPDLAASRMFLNDFMKRLEDDLRRRAALPAPPSPPASARPAPVSPSASLPKPGDRVAAVLVEEKTKKGGWKARLAQGAPQSGAVQNTDDVPPDAVPGQQVTLIVATLSPAADGSIREIQFRWPTAADEARSQKKPSTPPRGPRRR